LYKIVIEMAWNKRSYFNVTGSSVRKIVSAQASFISGSDLD